MQVAVRPSSVAICHFEDSVLKTALVTLAEKLMSLRKLRTLSTWAKYRLSSSCPGNLSDQFQERHTSGIVNW